MALGASSITTLTGRLAETRQGMAAYEAARALLQKAGSAQMRTSHIDREVALGWMREAAD